ncbi:hypothetical protein PMIT1306_01517 [Prochlorococcus sp. MIT 1306]|nr:hypothetical protein PMIT1306_01517 [Prochlorococcus sp. MIT 1306]
MPLFKAQPAVASLDKTSFPNLKTIYYYFSADALN